MRADAHRQAAEDLEYTISLIQADPRATRTIIEDAWGAGFQWIAFKCQQTHGQHRENHQGLVAYLRGLGGTAASNWRSDLERLRQQGWYNYQHGPREIALALSLLGQIRGWATT